jgi:diguanylate cyclase (GGDEF)-like protein
MMGTFDRGHKIGKIFSISLAQIRLKIAPVNALLFGLTVGLRGNGSDYIICFSYFFLNIVFLVFKGVGFLVTRPLRFLLFGVDLVIAGYMMMRTGGLHSALYPYFYIPVLIAVLRFRYPGVFIWCSLMAAMLALVAVLSKTLEILPFVIKIGYLYVAGIVGGYLISHNYIVTEAVSKRLTRWNIELQRLNNFSHQVIGGSDLSKIFEQTLKTVQQNGSFPMAAILIFDEDELLRIHANRGWDDKWLQSYQAHPLSKDSEFLAGIIGYRSPVLCEDIKKHQELIKVFMDTPVESLQAFPLVAREERDEVVGILMVSSPAVRAMQEQEYSILAGIANQASIALQNATSLYTEQAKAYTDGLTGLYNRRYFNEQIENANLKGGKTNLSLILLDVDDFKKYNDTYGHPEGDRLLKLIAGAILETVREQDIVARYGGEEFAVILNETNNATATEIAERIRLAVEILPSKLLKSPVTISVGVATSPDHAKDRGGLIDYADKSLYYAKNTGKNKVCGSFNQNLKRIH